MDSRKPVAAETSAAVGDVAWRVGSTRVGGATGEGPTAVSCWRAAAARTLLTYFHAAPHTAAGGAAPTQQDRASPHRVRSLRDGTRRISTSSRGSSRRCRCRSRLTCCARACAEVSGAITLCAASVTRQSETRSMSTRFPLDLRRSEGLTLRPLLLSMSPAAATFDEHSWC